MKKFGNNKVRVRFAPSPTGYLHVGSLRTALFNWLFAKKYNGSFILRIEDTDRERSTADFLHSQLADLEWMQLRWDEGPVIGGRKGPYFQSKRLHIYSRYAEKLVGEGKAYRCYCTPEELKAQREEAEKTGDYSNYGKKCRNLTPERVKELEAMGRKPCIKLLVTDEGQTVIQDAVKGEVSFDNEVIEDFVIMKSDGMPTYNFAVVIDDHLMGISHVIRGDEHMSNTPRQALLYEALDFPRPVFCHIPIILNPDRTKLSKRKGAVHLQEFREQGYLREALLNFIALLGWAPKDGREIMSAEELVEAFSLNGVTTHPAVFDQEKLTWMNGKYLNMLPLEEIIARLKPFLAKKGMNPGEKDDAWYLKAVDLYRKRMKTMEELADNLEYFFEEVDKYDPRGEKKHFKKDFILDALEELAKRYNQVSEFNEKNLEKILRNYARELGCSAGKLIHASRLACTGRTASPPIFDVMVLLGKDKLVKRLKKAAGYIRKVRQTDD